MSVTARCLIEAKYAANTDTLEYTAPANTRVIVDKFTVTNTDGSSRTITVNIVPSGGSVGASNIITSAQSISAGQSTSLGEMQNHILNAGDTIYVKASVASLLVIRLSGRECT